VAVNEKFGILIEGKDSATPAFNSAAGSLAHLEQGMGKLGAAGSHAVPAISSVSREISQMALQSAAGSSRLGTLAMGLSGLNLGAAAAAGAVAALGSAMFAATKHIADYQEQQDIAASTTGLTTGQLGGLRIAAAESGRSFEQVRPSLDYFTRKIGEAGAGSAEARAAFDQLKVAVKQGNELRATGDVLRDVQNALLNIPSAAERTRLAFELFGRGGAASMAALLTPLDQAEEKARKLGVALGPEAEAIARKADAAFDQLNTSMQGIANSAGVAAAKIAGPFVAALASAATAIATFMNDPQTGRFFEKMAGVAHGPVGMFVGTIPGGDVLTSAVQYLGAGPSGPRNPSHGLTDMDENRGVSAEGRANFQKWYEAQEKAAEAAADLSKAMEHFREGAAFEASLKTPYDSRRSFLPIPMKNDPYSNKPLDPYNVTPVSGGTQQMETPGLKGLDEKAKKASVAVSAFNSVLDQAGSQLVSSFMDVVRGTKPLIDALGDFFMSLTTQAASSFVGGLFSSLALSSGGMIGARSGLLVGGVSGRDSIPIMAMPGEAVISRDDTTAWHSLMPKMNRFIASMEKRGAGAPSLHFNYYGSDGGSGYDDFRRTVRDEIIPEVVRSLSRGVA
jgi:hypothetical protein